MRVPQGARAGLVALAAVLAPVLAQQSPGTQVALRDGTVVEAVGLRGDREAGLELDLVGGGSRRVDVAAVLSIHAAPVVIPALPVAELAGGDVFRGAVVGGDVGGNTLELQSPVLGRLVLAVDRLAALACRPGLAAATLPTGVDEALFVRAAVGCDVVAGTLHQFGELGVRFQPEAAATPRWYALGDFETLRFGAATAPAAVPPDLLLTRTGDRLAVRAVRWRDGQLVVALEPGAEVTLRLADVGCLVLGGGVVFASDLAPVAAEESGCDGELLRPWQRDHSAEGGPLLVAGRAHGKGLGVHSRSKLTFQVPPGCDRFWVRVGLDDSVSELPFEPEAEARVVVAGAVRFRAAALRGGQAPADSGLLPVTPGELVVLEADFGRGRDLGDRVDWLSPVFLPAVPRRP
jgi:hypothetical protein